MQDVKSSLHNGALLMTLASLAFIGYAIAFVVRSFVGPGFALGFDTLNGVTREQLDALNPAVMAYITHLHLATSGFIAATGIAVALLSWYGVRKGMMWAWVAAVASPVVGEAVGLPLHWFGGVKHDWVAHLGLIYLATLVFVVGALMALKDLMKKPSSPTPQA